MSTFQDDPRYVFDKVSSLDFYRLVNRSLIDRAAPSEEGVLVDVGCGSGAATELLLERVKPGAEIIGLEPSSSELALARERIRAPNVTFHEASAEALPRLVPSADAIFLCNVIHLIPAAEREELFRTCARVLKPGGVLAFNTTFFTGAQGPGTAVFYMKWIQRAARQLESAGLSVRPGAEAPALQTARPEEYAEVLTRAGFATVSCEPELHDFPIEGWDGLSEYAMFARGIFPSVPVTAASSALKAALHEVATELRLTSVPRFFLQAVARVA